jgi:hypothetical protein
MRPGLNLRHVLAARAEFLGRKPFTAPAPALMAAPSPEAVSLAAYRVRWQDQGRTGTCWVQAPVKIAEIRGKYLGRLAFPVCRRLVGYEGCRLAGGGNMDDGGSGLYAVRAMCGEGGGLAPEDLCPFVESREELALPPPAGVYEAAAGVRLVTPVLVDREAGESPGWVPDVVFDRIRALVTAGIPVAVGTWWPDAWGPGKTFHAEVGPGTYGHEVLVIGYARPGVFDRHAWWQFDDSRGLAYPPLSRAQALLVPGYATWDERRDSALWVRDDCFRTAAGLGGFEAHTAVYDPGHVRGLYVTETGVEDLFLPRP